MNTQDTLQALQAFVNQRPGFDWHNYDSMASYRSDYRPVLQAKHDFETMLNAINWKTSITADDIVKASQSAFSGRLSIVDKGERSIEIDYCTGQYFPVEYRNAACAVLASVLWAYWRDCGYETYKDIQKQARRELGRGIASRWFA